MPSSLGFQAGFQIVREALGFTRKQIADRLAITTTSYARYERGERSIYLHQASTVAQMLGVPIDILTRTPAIEELVALNQQRLRAGEPSPAPALKPRPVMRTGGGITAAARPYTDGEMVQFGHDISQYEPHPDTLHRPEIEAIHNAGEVMGNDTIDLDELKREWGAESEY